LPIKADEKAKLISDIGAVLKEHGLGDVEVKTVTEDVTNLSGKTNERNISLSVSKELPSTKADQAKAFSEAIKPVIEGIDEVSINVVSKLGAGDAYSTIEDIVPLGTEDHINLEHKEGEVWLIDFWATWCPPCQGPMGHN